MPRWCKFTDIEHEERARFLGYRAILQALDKSIEDSKHCNEGRKNKMEKLKRRGLTKSQMKSYQDFKANALQRFDFGCETDDILEFDLENRDNQKSRKTELILNLKHTSEAYYNYYRSLESQANAQENPFTEPAQVFSNIQNGYGIFAVYLSDSTVLPIK